MVKEEESSPLPKRTLGSKKYTNSELPAGALDNGIWQQIFIPTYIQYLASQNSNDTWTISDNDVIQLIQQIWDFIYGARVKYHIKIRGPVFFLVSVFSHTNVSSSESSLLLVDIILGESTWLRMAQWIWFGRTCYRQCLFQRRQQWLWFKWSLQGICKFLAWEIHIPFRQH